MRKVMMQLTQPHHDTDGAVLHQPGGLFAEDDPLVAELPQGSFKPVFEDVPEQAAAAAEPAAAEPRKAAAAKAAPKT